jgi:hypothetical protein
MNATQTETATAAVHTGAVIEDVHHGAVLRHHRHASEFDYLFAGLRRDADSHLPADDPPRVIALLRRLGGAMAEPAAGAASSSSIPAVYTYWGQFIDHDLTLEDSEDPRLQGPAVGDPAMRPVAPDVVHRRLGNARHPYLNLDSVYGDGPAGEAADFYDGARMRLGTLATGGPGEEVPAARDPEHRDLPGRVRTPRPGGSDTFPARIGDSRNDENLVVAQLHVAYLRFHNAVVDSSPATSPACPPTGCSPGRSGSSGTRTSG